MAFWAQLASHATSQQEMSKEQTNSQQVASAQPGEVLGAQQSFAFGAPHWANAEPAIASEVPKPRAIS